MKHYKLLDENDKGRYSRFKWDVSGNWMSVRGPLKMCGNGFHVLRLSDIGMWLECGFNLYEVETSGDRTESEDNICVRSVRVVKKVESYNKSALLELVIRPAVKRAKKHAACVAAAFADDRSADATYAAVAYAAARAIAATDAGADACGRTAENCAAEYSAAAAYAADAAAAHTAAHIDITEWADAVAATDVEIALQTKAIKKIIAGN